MDEEHSKEVNILFVKYWHRYTYPSAEIHKHTRMQTIAQVHTLKKTSVSPQPFWHLETQM